MKKFPYNKKKLNLKTNSHDKFLCGFAFKIVKKCPPRFHIFLTFLNLPKHFRKRINFKFRRWNLFEI